MQDQVHEFVFEGLIVRDRSGREVDGGLGLRLEVWAGVGVLIGV